MRLSDILYGRVEPKRGEISQDMVRNAQKVMLEILCEFDRICERYNLAYWLDSGTLLGAVRHEGFIPWDDDLDVCMPIEDYFKFLDVAKEELPNGLFLQTKESDRHAKWYYAKIRSNKGRILELWEVMKLLQGREIKFNTGLYIDIFPCITISEEEVKKRDLYFKFGDRIRKIADFYPLVNRIFNLIDFSLHRGWDNEELVVVRSIRFPEIEFKVKLKDIFPLKKYEFEGKSFWGPKNYDTYLRCLYGDTYMQPPPPKQRHAHAYVLEVFR